MALANLGDPEVKRRVLARLSSLKADAPAVWGKMCAAGMICHLSDSFRAVLGEKSVSPAAGWFSRTGMKWVALYVPAPWPKGIKTRPEVEQGAGGTPPCEFDGDRRLLCELIERFCESPPDLNRATHPIFGEMRRSEWLRWGYLHIDHHLRQFGV